MRSELLQQPVLHDSDTIGVVCRVQTVSDRDDGTPREHRRKRALEMTGRARIEQ